MLVFSPCNCKEVLFSSLSYFLFYFLKFYVLFYIIIYIVLFNLCTNLLQKLTINKKLHLKKLQPLLLTTQAKLRCVFSSHLALFLHFLLPAAGFNAVVLVRKATMSVLTWSSRVYTRFSILSNIFWQYWDCALRYIKYLSNVTLV